MLMWIDRNRQGGKLLGLGIEVAIFTLATFVLNILAPPLGVPTSLHIGALFAIFQNYLDVRLACRSLLLSTWQQLVAEFGADEQNGNWPDLIQLLQALKGLRLSRSTKAYQHVQTLLVRLEMLIETLGPHMLDCSQGYPDKALFDELDWVLEIEVPSDIAAFLTATLAARLYYYRLCNNQFTPHLRNLIVIDEAGELFDVMRERNQDAVESVLTQTILPRARALGIGFLCGSQEYDSLSRSLRSNAGIQILCGGALGRGEDTEAFGRSNGLTPDQIEFIKGI